MPRAARKGTDTKSKSDQKQVSDHGMGFSRRINKPCQIFITHDVDEITDDF